MSKLRIEQPTHHIFEKVALELAATWYEVGRGQGMTSKHKNARTYARANFEKFLPKAIEHCIDMLANPNFPEEAKQVIYDALMERANNPTNDLDVMTQPNIDITKLIRPVEQNLIPKREQPTVIHNISKSRH